MNKLLKQWLFVMLFTMLPMTVYGGTWYRGGNYYTFYSGQPGNIGPEIPAEIRESSSTHSYEARVNGEILKGQWLGYCHSVYNPDVPNWCYFLPSGKEAMNWTQIDGKWYNFGGGGTALSGWHRIDQQYYYFDPVTYIMKTSGTEMRDGIEYEFSPNGVSNIVGGLKNAGENGTEGWKEENGKWYYLRDGQKVVNQWLVNGADRYYVGADGERYVGWCEVDGVLYCFDYKGIAEKNRIMYYDDHKYTLDAEGRAMDTEMTPEERMEHSNLRKWCECTYAIYTRSQTVAGMAAQINGETSPAEAALLQRDWGITTKEQCVETINRLADAGRTSHTKSDKAWNFSRAMLLCESMERMGWVTMVERLDMQIAMAVDIQSSFTSWNDYNDSYMQGFRGWATNTTTIQLREYAYQNTKNSSYYFPVDWNQALNKTW